MILRTIPGRDPRILASRVVVPARTEASAHKKAARPDGLAAWFVIQMIRDG